MSKAKRGSVYGCAFTALERLESRWLLSAVSVNTSTQYQTIDGFGASIKSWVHDDTYYNAGFWNKMVGDLGANMIRGAIWPTFEKANDNNDPRTFDWSRFDSAALAHVMELFEQVDQRTPNARFNLTVWTAPWWMKTTQSHIDGGSLRSDMREEFAEYLAAVVIAARRDYGIDLDYLSIQNEPVFTLDYESMTLDPWQIRETIRVVNRRFKAEGLGTQLLIADDLLTPTRFRWLTEPTMTDPETRNFQGHFSIHGYASSQNWKGLRDVIESYNPDKPLQMTEGSGEPNDWGGAMTLAYTMRQAFEEGNATSFHYWQFTDPSGPNSLTHDGVDTGKAPIFKQFSRYVRPGMRHVGSSSDDSRILPVSFRDPATGHVTIVLINSSHDTVPVNVNVSGANLPSGYKVVRTTQTAYNQSLGTLAGGTGLNVTMPPKSVITLYTGSAAPTVNSGAAPVRRPIQPLWDTSNGTAIHQNAFRGTASSVQARLNAGDNVNATIGAGWAPLHAAAASKSGNFLSIIDTLVAAGANVHARTSDTGLTPLHVAAMSSTVKWPIDQTFVVQRLQKLVEKGANINAKDNAGRTPLHWAAMTGKIFIPAQGARVLEADMVEKLIDLGADVDAKDNAGLTAAQYAMIYDYDVIIDALVAAGADDPRTQPPPPTGTTTLHPTADTYVRDGASAGSNFGSSGALQLKWATQASGYHRETYLRFDLSSVSAIGSAKLRLYGRIAEGTGSIPVTVHGITSNPAWAEGSTTWNNKPAAGATIRAQTTISSTNNQWHEWDLTNYLKSEKAAGRNVVTLVLKAATQTGVPWISFNSDESGSNRPHLLINGSQSTPPPQQQGIVVSGANLNVNEGASNSVTVRLASQPSANVTVNLSKRSGGDASLGSSVGTLTFTPSNWNSPQTVQISAAQDADTINGTATWDITSAGLSSKVLNVTEIDDDDVLTSTILRPVADTYVRDGASANANFGGATSLQLKWATQPSGYNREIYLRFDLSNVSSIPSAKLRLNGRVAEGSGPIPVNVHGITSNPGWSETGTTWNNKPAAGWTIRASETVSSTTDQWHEWDLTSYLQAEKAAGRNAVTLVLRAAAQTSIPWLSFNSDEATSNRPELVIG